VSPLGARVRGAFGLPNFDDIQKALDADFAALTARLDTLIDLERQILAVLSQAPPPR
jgi:hypothetical protein